MLKRLTCKAKRRAKKMIYEFRSNEVLLRMEQAFRGNIAKASGFPCFVAQRPA